MKKLPLALAGVAVLTLSTACSTKHNPEGTYDPTSVDTRATYTIYLNPGEGYISSSSLKVKGGDKLSSPSAIPSLAGYSFVEWCLEYDAGKKMGKEGTGVSFPLPITDNLVLYARYAKQSTPVHTEEEKDAYMAGLAEKSEDNHFYLHYYRYGNSPSFYADWDVWAWPYKPKAGEGHKFDFVGNQSGRAEVDDFGGAYIDIDLSATYESGWDNVNKEFDDIPMSFAGSTAIGLQIVKSSTRTAPDSEFWTNDGSDFFLTLSDFALPLQNGGTAYHAFVGQDQVQRSLSARPVTVEGSPFDDDDGSNVTYGDSRYDDVDWDANHQQMPTAPSFKDVGVGYQIMVSSFADSDGTRLPR